jgi:hypothetical protein
MQDVALIGHGEALHVQRVRGLFFSRLGALLEADRNGEGAT